MMMPQDRAAHELIATALACYRAPALHGEFLRGESPPPKDIAVLLRLAGGSEIHELGLAGFPEHDSADLNVAARFFVEQTMFRRDADHYRLLGIDPDASEQVIKEHHRLLMRMLHPDRTPDTDDWRGGYANRVNHAYNVLRNAHSRAAYDAELLAAREASAETVKHQRGASVRYVHDGLGSYGSANKRSGHRVPFFVLTGVAAIAALYVGGVYLSNRADTVNQASAGEAATVPTTTEPGHAPHTEDKLSDLSPQVMAKLENLLNTDAEKRQPPQPPHPESLESGKTKTSQAPITPARNPASVRGDATGLVGSQKPQGNVSLATAPITNSGGVSQRQRESDVPPVVRNEPVADTATLEPQRATQMLQMDKAVDDRLIATAKMEERDVHKLSPDDLEKLFARYVFYYERGDIGGFMSLFDDDARSASGGKSKIRQDYANFFKSTSTRQLELTQPSWGGGGSAFIGKVPFRATIRNLNETQNKVFAGSIYFEVEKRKGSAVITALFYTYQDRS